MIRGGALAAALLLVGACGDDDSAESTQAPEAESPSPAETPEGPDTRQIPPEPRAPAVPLRVEGPVRVNGEVVTGEARLSAGDRIETGDGAMATILTPPPDGGQVVLSPGGVLRLDRLEPFTVVIARGRVRATLPPAGGSQRQPLRVGAPEASLEIGGSGDVVVAVAEDGRTWLSVLTGRAEVDRGELGEGDRPVRHTLVAGRAVVADGSLPEEPSEGPAREDAIEAAAAAALPARPARSERMAEQLREATEALGVLVEEMTAEAQRGDALADRHRDSSGAEARAIQREIVAHSQRALRLRRALRTRWERVLAWRDLLDSAGHPQDLDAALVRRARAHLE